ncbi:hypothetical protein H4582DRAFT_2129029 [Lactarius indigo]|nr:hypothetical protein H4582DRAFT_2129029 [Lactarius indigo]
MFLHGSGLLWPSGLRPPSLAAQKDLPSASQPAHSHGASVAERQTPSIVRVELPIQTIAHYDAYYQNASIVKTPAPVTWLRAHDEKENFVKFGVGPVRRCAEINTAGGKGLTRRDRLRTDFQVGL